MTPTSIQPVSQTAPVHTSSSAGGSPEKPRVASAVPAYKVELSADSVAGQLKQESQPPVSKSAAAHAASNLRHSPQKPAVAPASHQDKVVLSTISRAELLRREGENIPEIAIDLNVPPKTVEDYFNLTSGSASAAQIMGVHVETGS